MTLPRSLSDLLVALNRTPRTGRDAICRLASRVPDWAGSRSALLCCCRQIGLPSQKAVSIADWLARAARHSATEHKRADEHGARIITRYDHDYPAALLDLELPPPVLYCKGTLGAEPSVAIVGSRNARSVNLEVAKMLARELASVGITIVSGFARGIDQAAHAGALSTEGGTTVAVLGCGIDVDYPRGCRALADRIACAGARVSEFPLGTGPRKLNFPIRNRLIAALSLGTLVVQATVRSGSLITARLAADLGRDVYAVPGAVLDPASIGPNTLIRDGALLVQEARDIVESLPLHTRELIQARASGGESRSTASGLLAWMHKGELVSVDELSERTGHPTEQILHRLLDLELAGRIRRCPGPKFLRRL